MARVRPVPAKASRCAEPIRRWGRGQKRLEATQTAPDLLQARQKMRHASSNRGSALHAGCWAHRPVDSAASPAYFHPQPKAPRCYLGKRTPQPTVPDPELADRRPHSGPSTPKVRARSSGPPGWQSTERSCDGHEIASACEHKSRTRSRIGV